MAMSETKAPLDPGSNSDYRLDSVLLRVSSLLEELSVACLEVQASGAELKEVHSAEAVIKTQALDRITQSLQSLAQFHAELSHLDGAKEILTSDKAFSSVQLASVRDVLENRSQSIYDTDSDEISLFDD